MEPDPQISAPRRVEAYLNEVLAPLATRLSPFQQVELRQELHEHLWGRIDAYRELGQADEEAVTEALRQFGGAEDFRRQWRQEWVQAARSVARQELWCATITGLRLSFFALLLLTVVSALLASCDSVAVWISHRAVYGAPIWWLYAFLTTSTLMVTIAISWAGMVILPVALGVIMGRLSPRYAGWGMCAALTGQILSGAVLIGLNEKCWPHSVIVSQLFAGIAFRELVWLPLACTAAALTEWRIQRTRKVLA